jgi:hypothetical protein
MWTVAQMKRARPNIRCKKLSLTLEIPVRRDIAELLPVEDNKKGTIAKDKKPARFELILRSTLSSSRGRTADIKAIVTRTAPKGGQIPFAALYENLLTIKFSA